MSILICCGLVQARYTANPTEASSQPSPLTYIMMILTQRQKHVYLSKAYTMFRMLGGTISANIGLLQQGPACSISWQDFDVREVLHDYSEGRSSNASNAIH